MVLGESGHLWLSSLLWPCMGVSGLLWLFMVELSLLLVLVMHGKVEWSGGVEVLWWVGSPLLALV